MKTGAIRPIEQNDYLIKELKKQKEKQHEKEQKGYTFIIDGMKLPVTPEKLTVKIGNNNKTYTLMNDGEINILKTPGLTEIEFEALLPNVEYSFAEYENGFKNAKAYLNKLEKLKKILGYDILKNEMFSGRIYDYRRCFKYGHGCACFCFLKTVS